MARPRVFVSSTYYDLKHVRSSLDSFIESLGFDSVLSEKGDIAYSPDTPLDESCYREAATADIFVLIIGGRYGSPTSSDDKKPSPTFFERYESVTKKEYESAVDRDMPTYILIESSVYSEYETFLRNKDNENVQYAHVDSINVFRLIEEILAKPRNNPVHKFERFPDIEAWLREQWAGLFRELLQRTTNQQQLATLSSQVETLGAINSTLQRYLETVVQKVSPEDAAQLIESERKKLNDLEQIEHLRHNAFYRGAKLGMELGISAEQYRDALMVATTFEEFAEHIGNAIEDVSCTARIVALLDRGTACWDINAGRGVLGLPPFEIPESAS